MNDRIRAILDAGDKVGLPEIARALALDSDLSLEAAEKVLAAGKQDIAAATASIGQAITAPPSPGQPAGNRAGTSLGVADIIGGDTSAEKAKAGWAKAVAALNARYE